MGPPSFLLSQKYLSSLSQKNSSSLSQKLLFNPTGPANVAASTASEMYGHRRLSFNEYVMQREISHSYLSSSSIDTPANGETPRLGSESHHSLLFAPPSVLHCLATCVDWGEDANRALRATIIENNPKITVTFDTGADTHQRCPASVH